jgi:hypothetical protein
MSGCQLTLLAQRDAMRYLAHCEHGTLHLRWRRSTLQLTSQEFNAMAQFLALWRENERAATASDSCVSLFRDSSGMIQLWIVGVGLYLTHDDLLLLIELIDEVVHQSNALSFEPASAGQQLRNTGQYRELRVVPDGVCFAN